MPETREKGHTVILLEHLIRVCTEQSCTIKGDDGVFLELDTTVSVPRLEKDRWTEDEDNWCYKNAETVGRELDKESRVVQVHQGCTAFSERGGCRSCRGSREIVKDGTRARRQRALRRYSVESSTTSERRRFSCLAPVASDRRWNVLKLWMRIGGRRQESRCGWKETGQKRRLRV